MLKLPPEAIEKMLKLPLLPSILREVLTVGVKSKFRMAPPVPAELAEKVELESSMIPPVRIAPPRLLAVFP